MAKTADAAKVIAAVALIVAVVGLATTLYGFTSLVTPASSGHDTAGPPGPAGNNGSTGPPGQNGAPGHNGTNGSQGPPGQNGSQGGAGRNGTNGTSPTYASFQATFALVGKTTTVAMQAEPCTAAGNGAYACNVTLTVNGTDDVEFQGLNYSFTQSYYWAGSDPSTDWLLDENTSTTFQLWFQVTASSGVLEPVIYLHVGELSRS